MRLAGIVVILASACGGKPAPVQPKSDGEASADCEPGRCLADVARLVLERRTEARACYDEGRKRKPDIAGKLVIGFEFDPEGTVIDAHQTVADGQFEEDGVVACISDVIKKIKFPASKKGSTTRAYHHFEFVPNAKQ